jgi:hypothetical protein
MHWLDHWKVLAIRIDCLLRTGEYALSAFAVCPDNVGGTYFDEVVGASLKPEVESIMSELRALLEVGGREIPADAIGAAKAYLDGGWSLANTAAKQAPLKLMPLAVFRGRFDYFVRDAEVEARSLVELAFEHLRRRIAVDEPYAKQWRVAFHRNEPKCERLGAVHLLSHGIWAFKVQGNGAATDLVCGELIAGEIGLIQRTARTLALTEWKLIRTEAELDSKAAEAKAQAELYTAGVLQTVVLKRTRYLILVAKDDLAPPPDVSVGGITYRHIVVPVEPGTPSQTARSRSRS